MVTSYGYELVFINFALDIGRLWLTVGRSEDI